MRGYTGEVVAGGPGDVRELPGLRVTKVSVGTFDNNVYVLRCTATGTTVVVDGADEPERLLAEVGDGTLDAIVQTHGHWDHVRAIAAVRSATGAALLCHEGDAEMMPEPPTGLVADGDVLRVGEASLRAIHLAGHTPGGLALLYEGDPERPHLFTGDSLFPGGPGNTQNDPDRFASLMGDLEAKVFGALPDSTWVYPGHGKDTTLGTERPSLPEWRARGW